MLGPLNLFNSTPLLYIAPRENNKLIKKIRFWIYFFKFVLLTIDMVTHVLN